ncbi:TolC family protein [Prolixibacteraceae bacterium Z1-6]|uniref:TolC family protein n=1 Tax=Draconibacterium aestuarii TaxID=2998507 RepID=A0A9X3FAJ3_9BACT|nr:TolC family protein [Prolixibacteraceae bacterium Z1-6]
MSKLIVKMLLLILPFGLSAQNIENVLSEIESNNTTLRAYRNLNEVQKLENKTGIYLDNPEIGFNYLWGDPSTMGNRKDFSFTQSFDFPTAYGIKKRIASARNEQSDLEFELQRKSILYQAKILCNELVYLNALHEVLQKRATDAGNIAKAYSSKFDQGEINILEKNKAQFNLLNAQKELEVNETERSVLLAELSTLNGGIPVSFNQTSFSPLQLPVDFENWYTDYESKNIVLQQAAREIGISENQIKLSRAMSLPKISGGYMSEAVEGEAFRGVSVGVSIPLWENKNTVKLATAQQQVALQMANDKKIQTYNQLKGQYEKAVSLQKTLASYREALQAVNSSDLLKKALDAGQLSLIEYIMELTLYYETTDKFLSIENELNQLATGLYFFEL